jgi:flagellar basal-body rod modification protein FlgD
MINKIQPTIDAISPDSLREGNSTGRMSREEFLRLLTTQLQHQDPTDPMDNSKVLEQLSMLENLEAVGTLTTTLNSMVTSQSLGSAANLIGKHVAAIGADGQRVEGIVSGLVSGADGIKLVINGQRVDVGQIQEVRNPLEGEAAA